MLLIVSFTELKDQESNPSVVCRCCSNRVNFLTFSYATEPLDQVQPNVYKA